MQSVFWRGKIRRFQLDGFDGFVLIRCIVGRGPSYRLVRLLSAWPGPRRSLECFAIRSGRSVDPVLGSQVFFCAISVVFPCLPTSETEGSFTFAFGCDSMWRWLFFFLPPRPPPPTPLTGVAPVPNVAWQPLPLAPILLFLLCFVCRIAFERWVDSRRIAIV